MRLPRCYNSEVGRLSPDLAELAHKWHTKMSQSADPTIVCKELSEMATALMDELCENDWLLPFLSQSDEAMAVWHRTAQIKGVNDPEAVSQRNEWESIRKRHSLWEFNTRQFVFGCQRYLNEFDDSQQMRRLQGNVLWQILVAADNSMNPASYMKEQCLADLQSMARLCGEACLSLIGKGRGPLKPKHVGSAEPSESQQKRWAECRKKMIAAFRNQAQRTNAELYTSHAVQVDKADFYRWLRGELSDQSALTKRIEGEIAKNLSGAPSE